MERYKPQNLNTEPDLMKVLDQYKSQEEKKYISVGSETPYLSLKPYQPKDYGMIATTEAEFKLIQASIMADEEGKAKCRPEIFDDSELNVRWLKASMVNLYYDYRGNWSDMKRDPQCVADGTLRRYWQDPKFRLCIKAYDDIFNLKAKAVITDLLDSTDERVKLAAAQTWLRANEAETWDPGVKKQIVANKGSIANTFFKQAVSENDFLKTLTADPFSRLSELARKELQDAIGITAPLRDALPVIEGEVISPRMPKDPFDVEQSD